MDGPLSKRQCLFLAGLLILGSAVLRFCYLAFNCPLDLAPDEAHYWDWSRHPDWSYYSKGPGIAWLIRLSCDLFGSFSVQLTGNEMLAVRLPAIVCGSLLLVSLYVLTVQASGRHGVALAVVAVALTMPVFSIGSSLMTIDSPYSCCWGWALVAVHHAIFGRSLWAWAAAGVLVAVGVLFKYTMVVWLPSLACFLLFSREYRSLLWSRGFWIMCGFASLSGLPILIWNALNGWVTFHHVSVLAGLRQEEPRFYWLGPLQFVAVQCAMWLVFWFIVWARAMLAHAPWKTSTSSMHFLWWMSASMFGVFFLFGFKTGGGQPNWPVTAYASGLVLGLLWLADELRRANGWYRRAVLGGMATACSVGVLMALCGHYSALAHPLLERFAGPATAEQPFPLRRFDPTMRLRGWRELAAGVDQIRHHLQANDEDLILAGTGWNMPGLIGFYCADHPVVYSLGFAFGDRRSQYDFWRPNPIWDTEQFAGKTVVVVSSSPLNLESAFASVETHHLVTHTETGQPMADWYIHVGRGYKGFALEIDPAKNGKY